MRRPTARLDEQLAHHAVKACPGRREILEEQDSLRDDGSGRGGDERECHVSKAWNGTCGVWTVCDHETVPVQAWWPCGAWCRRTEAVCTHIRHAFRVADRKLITGTQDEESHRLSKITGVGRVAEEVALPPHVPGKCGGKADASARDIRRHRTRQWKIAFVTFCTCSTSSLARNTHAQTQVSLSGHHAQYTQSHTHIHARADERTPHSCVYQCAHRTRRRFRGGAIASLAAYSERLGRPVARILEQRPTTESVACRPPPSFRVAISQTGTEGVPSMVSPAEEEPCRRPRGRGVEPT